MLWRKSEERDEKYVERTKREIFSSVLCVLDKVKIGFKIAIIRYIIAKILELIL